MNPNTRYIYIHMLSTQCKDPDSLWELNTTNWFRKCIDDLAIGQSKILYHLKLVTPSQVSHP